MAIGTHRDVAAEVTERIVEALARGVAPWVRPWQSASPGPLAMPGNAYSGREYRGVNVLLLWMTGMERGYEDTRWLTYKQATELGGHVRKGERGTKVVLWKRIEVQDKEGETKQVLYAREYTVFNVEQCEGLSLKGASAPAPATVDEVLARVQAAGVKVQHGGNAACYSPALDVVCMPHMETFQDTGAYHSILLHEATHWTGHPTRLNRDFSGRFGSEAYAFEELVAELGSAFMCTALGVQGRLQHAEYLGHWLQVLRGDKYAVFTAARLAQEAMELVLGQGKGEEEQLVAAA